MFLFSDGSMTKMLELISKGKIQTKVGKPKNTILFQIGPLGEASAV